MTLTKGGPRVSVSTVDLRPLKRQVVLSAESVEWTLLLRSSTKIEEETRKFTQTFEGIGDTLRRVPPPVLGGRGSSDTLNVT